MPVVGDGRSAEGERAEHPIHPSSGSAYAGHERNPAAAWLGPLPDPGAGRRDQPSSPAPVVITTDCGADMDDQWAIAHAALSPRIATLAVIGGFAPEPHLLGSADTARCARQALASVDRLAGIPVHEGAGGRSPGSCDPVRSEGVEQLVRLSTGSRPCVACSSSGSGP